MTKHVYRLSVEIRTENAAFDSGEDAANHVYRTLDAAMVGDLKGAYVTSRDESYNGWANRETWALNLWLSNDQGLYEMTRERVAEAVTPFRGNGPTMSRLAGEAVKDLWEELTSPDSDLNSGGLFESYVDNIVPMIRDVGSDYRVDWDEIGAAWLEDVAESPIGGDE